MNQYYNLKTNQASIGKWLLLMLLFLSTSVNLNAQNILQIQSTSVQALQECSISVSITNSQPFVGFQLDIPLHGQLSFVPNSGLLNPSRSNGHSLTTSLINGNTLRIIVFSFTNQAFVGGNGEVMSFKLMAGAIPSTYALPVINGVIASSNSMNILTSVIDGAVTLLAPEINPGISMINFGEIPLGGSLTMSMSLQNLGNQTLYISQITFDSPYFQVVGSSTFAVSAGQAATLTVRFNAQLKGVFTKTMKLFSNDPDEPILNIGMNATAFAVNELHCGTIQAASGSVATLGLSINNMEPFSAFQFDLLLPEPMTYVQNSVLLNPNRSNGHSVTAELINSNTLRVIGFSVTNQTFSGTSGEIVQLQFGINGTGGTYELQLSNVIIGDVSGQNIMSAYFSNVLVITAPDISLTESLQFGDVSILSSSSANLVIYNYGAEPLVLSSFGFTNLNFSTSAVFPVTIQPWSNASFLLQFSPSNVGVAEGLLNIYSNDPDESSFQVDLSANVYAPNYITIPPSGATQQDTVQIDLSIQNYDPFIAFECELHFNPDIMHFLGSVGYSYLTERATDHVLFTNEISPGIVKIISFSLQQSVFVGNEGPVAKLGFVVNAPTEGISYPINLANGVLANPQGQNVLYAMQDGTMTIIPELQCPEDLSACINQDPFLLTDGQPSGGAFSGIGVSGNYFYPEVAGIGSHPITYAYTWIQGFTHECVFFVTVNELPDVWLGSFPDVCEDEEPFQLYGGMPAGGSYSGTGVTENGWFDPSLSGVGTFPITYEYTDQNGCNSSATTQITVHPMPIVTLNAFPEVCINSEPLVLTGGFPDGGIYSGPGVDGSGIFHPETTGQGTFIIQYTFVNEYGCSSSASESIVVRPLSEASLIIVEGENPICENTQVTISISEIQNGGESPQFEWFMNDLSYGTNTTTFTFLPQDGDEVFCKMTSSANCLIDNPVVSNAVTIEVNQLPIVTLDLEQEIVCVFWDPISLNEGDPPGGIYSGDGVEGNIFNPTIAGVGSHTITYTYTDENGCQNQASDLILVDPCTSIVQISHKEIVQIHPNPASSFFMLNFKKEFEEDILLSIHGMNGEVIQMNILKKGQNSYLQQLTQISSGVYFVHLKNRSFNTYLKLIIR